MKCNDEIKELKGFLEIAIKEAEYWMFECNGREYTDNDEWHSRAKLLLSMRRCKEMVEGERVKVKLNGD